MKVEVSSEEWSCRWSTQWTKRVSVGRTVSKWMLFCWLGSDTSRTYHIWQGEWGMWVLCKKGKKLRFPEFGKWDGAFGFDDWVINSLWISSYREKRKEQRWGAERWCQGSQPAGQQEQGTKAVESPKGNGTTRWTRGISKCCCCFLR